MRYLLLLSLLFWPLGAQQAAAQSGSAADSSVALHFTSDSELVVEGSSNVRAWSMNVTSADGTVLVGDAGVKVPSINRVEVAVAVEDLVSDRSSMQEKAHKALKKTDHPEITFVSDDVTVGRAQGDTFGVFANGDLTIAGKTRSVEVQAKAFQESDGSYRIRGDHGIAMSDFNVERPSALLGTLTVDDAVRLEFDVTIAPDE